MACFRPCKNIGEKVEARFLIILALLSIFAPLAFADSLADELSAFESSLSANITVDNSVLEFNPQVILVKIEAYNPSSQPMPVYVLRQGSSGWEIVKLVGALAPNSRSDIELQIEAHYDKVQKRKTRYAVVGRGEDGQLHGSYFDISEDWTTYEQKLKEGLSNNLLTYVPIVGTLLVALLIVLVEIAYTSKSPEAVKGEYTMSTLVFPKLQGRPFEELIADIMINPIIMLAELACVSILVFVMFDGLSQSAGPEEGLKIMVLSALGSFSIPFLFFAAAWYFEKREEGKPLRFFAGMFAWGMFSAFLSLVISSGLVSELNLLDPTTGILLATIFIAPVVEETLKGLGVLFISGHHEYNDTLTGLLLGFTCGAGFAFVENWFYFSSKANPFEIGLASWGMLILYRSFFNTLAHGCFTAAVSTPIGYLKSSERLRSFARLAFAPGVFLAVVIHSVFNLSALADGFVIARREMLFFVFNPILIILLAAMFFLLLVFATIEEKRRRIAGGSPHPG